MSDELSCAGRWEALSAWLHSDDADYFTDLVAESGGWLPFLESLEVMESFGISWSDFSRARLAALVDAALVASQRGT